MLNKLLFILCGSLLLTSCHLQKKSMINVYSGESKKVLTELIRQSNDFEYFQDKVRMHVKTKDLNQSFTVDLRMIKDSLIWGSVSVLFGLEIGRFFLTPQKLTVLDKIRKQYYEFNSDYLRTLLPFPEADLTLIQNLLLRNLILFGKEPYQMKADSDYLEFRVFYQSFYHQFRVQSGTYEIIDHQIFNQSEQLIGKAVYSGNIEGKNFKIPRKIEFWAYLPENNYARISFFEPKFLKKVKIDLSIPNDYQKAN